MSSKWSFTCIRGIFLPLNPSATTFYAQSAFFPQSAVLILHFAPSLRFTLSLQSAFYTPSAFYPWSAFRSPQSSFTVTGLHMQPSCSSALSKPSFKMATTWSKYYFFFSSGLAIFFLVVLTLIDIQRGKFSKQTVKSCMQNHTHSALGNNLHAVINKNPTSSYYNQLTAYATGRDKDPFTHLYLIFRDGKVDKRS